MLSFPRLLYQETLLFPDNLHPRNNFRLPMEQRRQISNFQIYRLWVTLTTLQFNVEC